MYEELHNGFDCWIVVCLLSSCVPNAVLHFDGNRAALRALEDTQEGTEVRFYGFVACVYQHTLKFSSLQLQCLE